MSKLLAIFLTVLSCGISVILFTVSFVLLKIIGTWRVSLPLRLSLMRILWSVILPVVSLLICRRIRIRCIVICITILSPNVAFRCLELLRNMCSTPILIRNPKAGIKGQREMLPVPCGKCNKCVASRIYHWIFRLEQEIKVSSQAFFVTLTYDEENVPKRAACGCSSRSDGAPVYNVLQSRDLTLYIKLLRFHYAKQSDFSLRYFAVGEYGRKYRRPHYHIILLNCDDVRLIQDTWPHGHVDIRPLSNAQAVGYCLKYLYKKDIYSPLGVKPFTRMSKGLGRNYFETPAGTIRPDIAEYHNRKLENCMVSLSNGIQIPLPKYFKDKLYSPRNRYLLTQYLQNRIDSFLLERVDAIHRATGLDEEKILQGIENETYISIFESRIVKPEIF